MSKNFTSYWSVTAYCDMLMGRCYESKGGLCAKSYDKDFKRKKNRRKIAKASQKRNRRTK